MLLSPLAVLSIDKLLKAVPIVSLYNLVIMAENFFGFLKYRF